MQENHYKKLNIMKRHYIVRWMNNMNMNSPKQNFLNDRSYYIVQKDESSGGILQQGMNEQQNMEKNNIKNEIKLI